jgi:anionic cell wall polymer biosynthesis LytR-Cps2A-Psr (LCP) family protein
VWIYSSQSSKHVTAGIGSSGADYRHIVYKGKEYEYNNQITTILYAGVDSEDTLESTEQYGDKPRADSIYLLVLDRLNKKMTVVSISRDTMTDVRRYSVSGKDLGLYTTHLGYAYSYGDGGQVSCENLEEAVSNLFNGIPIREYVVTNQSSITYINQLVDGVTVTVPNDDLVDLYPDMKKGSVVTLDDTNVRDYLHYRDTTKDFSNNNRLQRQQVYISAYIDKFKSEMETQDYNTIWNRFNTMSEYLQTSITKNQYLELVDLIDIVEFSDDYYTLEGEDTLGELHDEFYYDRDALDEKIVELFYYPV